MRADASRAQDAQANPTHRSIREKKYASRARWTRTRERNCGSKCKAVFPQGRRTTALLPCSPSALLSRGCTEATWPVPARASEPMKRALNLRRLRLLTSAWLLMTAEAHASVTEPHVVILVYHRFALTAQDSMTVRTGTFEAQLQSLRTHGYQVVPLRDVIKWLTDPTATLPPKTAVLTVDDGHRSVFEIL